MPSVYIETTIPSFYFETRRSATVASWREETRRWWREDAPRYDLVTSALVVKELELAPAPKRASALQLLSPVPRLGPLPGLEDVIEF
ncbi:MAG: hypothetical protein ACF8R7_16385 [Phycisphaerales bacterium JB039]